MKTIFLCYAILIPHPKIQKLLMHEKISFQTRRKEKKKKKSMTEKRKIG